MNTFYARSLDDFIETGSGGGIGFGLCEDILHAVIDEEKMTAIRRCHTIIEVKNGAGAVPIKREYDFIDKNQAYLQNDKMSDNCLFRHSVYNLT